MARADCRHTTIVYDYNKGYAVCEDEGCGQIFIMQNEHEIMIEQAKIINRLKREIDALKRELSDSAWFDK